MQMDHKDAIDEIYLAAERLRTVALTGDKCGRAGAAFVFYESEDLLFTIDTARDAIATSLGITRNTRMEKLGVCRAPVTPKGKKNTKPKRSPR